MWRMLDSTIRLSAMMRKYSSGEKKASTPSCSSRVPLLRKIHGMKAMKPLFPIRQTFPKTCRTRRIGKE